MWAVQHIRKSDVPKCANNKKLFRAVKIKADCKQLQKVITILGNWMIKCQMKFYIDKCQVLHITKNSSNYVYSGF